jgi:LysR family transcriptional activator of dmlA
MFGLHGLALRLDKQDERYSQLLVIQFNKYDIHNFQIVNKDWSLLDLQVFCCAAKRSSFVAAATELGISPAYVTKRIANLEKALGVSLFNRTTRRVQISEAGEAAYAWASRVLETAEEWTDLAPSPIKELTGTLRISTSLRLGRNHISPILDQLKEAHPKLDVWLELVDRRVDLLAEGIDIDVRMGAVNEPHLIAHPVMKNIRMLVASPEYIQKQGEPRTLQELAQHECLLYRERHQTFGTWRLQGPRGSESVRVSGTMGSNHSDIVRNWAIDGKGIVLLASWDVHNQVKSGRLIRVLPDYFEPADMYATTASRVNQSPKLQHCLKFLIDNLREGAFALRVKTQ